MTRLPAARQAWPGEAFKAILKAALEALGPRGLPLDRAVEQGCYLGDQPVTVSVQPFEDTGDAIAGQVAVFFTEIMASCGCGGEPMEQNGHCELGIRIDKATAETAITLIEE